MESFKIPQNTELPRASLSSALEARKFQRPRYNPRQEQGPAPGGARCGGRGGLRTAGQWASGERGGGEAARPDRSCLSSELVNSLIGHTWNCHKASTSSLRFWYLSSLRVGTRLCILCSSQHSIIHVVNSISKYLVNECRNHHKNVFSGAFFFHFQERTLRYIS